MGEDEERLAALERDLRDRRRLGEPTGSLPDQVAELRRRLKLPAPPPKSKPPAAPRREPGAPPQRRPLSRAQREQLERWHREHSHRGGVK